MKKVLIVSAYFPPMGYYVVQRLLKNIKSMVENGWTPYVLTPKVQKYFAFDDSVVRDVPEAVRVFKTFALNYSQLLYLTQRSRGINIVEELTIGNSHTLLGRIGRIIRNWVFIPDSHIGWIPFAVAEGIRICKRDGIDLIYCRAPLWSTLVIGCLIKAYAKIPLVGDFEDEWVGSASYCGLSRFRQRIDNCLESRIVSFSDKVICTTPGTTASFLKRYPSQPASKFVTITTGYDADDFAVGISKLAKSSRLTISYVGSVENRLEPENLIVTPKFFLQALRDFLDGKPDLADKIRVRFIGYFGSVNAKLVKRLHLDNEVEIVGHLNHKEARAEMMQADVLLLLLFSGGWGPRRIVYKVFEYLASGKPILALCPKGDTADIIVRTRSGFIVDPENVDSIKEAINGIFLKYENGTLPLNDQDRESIQQYERRPIGQKLITVMNGLTKGNNE